MVGYHRQDVLCARKGSCAKDDADLAAEAAASHERDPLGVFRKLVGELKGDATPEGMAHDRGTGVAELLEKVAQPACECAEGVVTTWLVRGPVPHKVGSDHVCVACQGRHDWLPGGAAAAQPVQEHDHGPAGIARDPVDHSVPV